LTLQEAYLAGVRSVMQTASFAADRIERGPSYRVGRQGYAVAALRALAEGYADFVTDPPVEAATSAVTPESAPTSALALAPPHPIPVLDQADLRRAEARVKGYEGDACRDCGNFTLVRNGTCLKCDTCGATTGCS
jgi:ribonucleoside-diphosphate reductase alpha chain